MQPPSLITSKYFQCGRGYLPQMEPCTRVSKKQTTLLSMHSLPSCHIPFRCHCSLSTEFFQQCLLIFLSDWDDEVSEGHEDADEEDDRLSVTLLKSSHLPSPFVLKIPSVPMQLYERKKRKKAYQCTLLPPGEVSVTRVASTLDTTLRRQPEMDCFCSDAPFIIAVRSGSNLSVLLPNSCLLTPKAFGFQPMPLPLQPKPHHQQQVLPAL